MATITGPLKYHSAYNPINFHVVAYGSSYPSYALNVNLNYKDKEERLSLVRTLNEINKKVVLSVPQGPSFDGEVDFDISGVVRNYFGTDSPKMIDDIEVDNRLFVRYTCDGKQYIAINSTEFAPLTEDDLKFGEKLLSALPIFRCYTGYDFDVSLLCGDNVSSFFTPNAVNRVKSRAIPVRYLRYGVDGDYIQDESGNYILIDGVNIENTPIPRNPFYVRWINRLGGVDYWMFGNSQQISIGVKDANTLLNCPTGQNTTFGIEAQREIVVGAAGISRKEWDVLSLLPLSPQIEWYDKKIGKWVTITASKVENSINTDRNIHDVDFVFSLPNLQTQFA